MGVIANKTKTKLERVVGTEKKVLESYESFLTVDRRMKEEGRFINLSVKVSEGETEKRMRMSFSKDTIKGWYPID